MYGIFTYIWVIIRTNVGNIRYMEHMGMENSQLCQNPVIDWEIKKNKLDAESQETALPSCPLVSRNDWFLSSIGPHQLTFDLTVVKWHSVLSHKHSGILSDILSDSHLQSVWHAIGPCIIWQSIWHSTSHVYTFISCVWTYLKHILTLCLTCLFHLTYSLAWKSNIYIYYDILADIWPSILSGILSDILSDFFFWHTFWTSIWHIIWPSYGHVFILSQFIWHAIWHMFWHFIWHIFLPSIGHSIGHIFCHVVWYFI